MKTKCNAHIQAYHRNHTAFNERKKSQYICRNQSPLWPMSIGSPCPPSHKLYQGQTRRLPFIFLPSPPPLKKHIPYGTKCSLPKSINGPNTSNPWLVFSRPQPILPLRHGSSVVWYPSQPRQQHVEPPYPPCHRQSLQKQPHGISRTDPSHLGHLPAP